MPRAASSSRTRLACRRSAITSVSVTSSVSTSGERPFACRCLRDPLDELAVGELAPRDVDGHPDGEAGAVPIRQLRAGLGEDEFADLADEAHLLGDRDEFVRRDRAVLRVVPPGQRFDLHDLTSADVGDGVVHHAELGPRLERMGQKSAQHEPPAHALVVLHRVQLDGAATFLGEVHGDVGPLEQQGHVVPVLGGHGDPGAGPSRRTSARRSRSGATARCADR